MKEEKRVTEFGETLSNAINNKKTDINQAVWKSKDGKDTRLVDMDSVMLNKAYHHCCDMLYNKSKFTPGRYTVKENIKVFIAHCNAELLKRYLLHECSIDIIKTPLELVQAVNSFKKQNNLTDSTTVDVMFDHLPKEYSTVKFGDLIAACLDQLEVINRKMISEHFIITQGIWLTDEEKKELTELDDNGKQKPWLDVIKERMIINPDIRLRVDIKGFSYSEFRLLLHLTPNPRISSLPSETLRVFRDKVFLLLDIDTDYHIKRWETIKSNIEQVAKLKEITLNIPSYK